MTNLSIKITEHVHKCFNLKKCSKQTTIDQVPAFS